MKLSTVPRMVGDWHPSEPGKDTPVMFPIRPISSTRYGTERAIHRVQRISTMRRDKAHLWRAGMAQIWRAEGTGNSLAQPFVSSVATEGKLGEGG